MLLKRDKPITDRLKPPALPRLKYNRIHQMPKEEMQRFHVAIFEGKTNAEISAEFGISKEMISGWKNDVIRHTIQADNLAREKEGKSQVREMISRIGDECFDSIDRVKGQGKHGESSLKRRKEEVKHNGSVQQLLGRAIEVARTIGELSGELGQTTRAHASPNTLNVILVPKIGESLPDTPPPLPSPTLGHLIDVHAEQETDGEQEAPLE